MRLELYALERRERARERGRGGEKSAKGSRRMNERESSRLNRSPKTMGGFRGVPSNELRGKFEVLSVEQNMSVTLTR